MQILTELYPPVNLKSDRVVCHFLVVRRKQQSPTFMITYKIIRHDVENQTNSFTTSSLIVIPKDTLWKKRLFFSIYSKKLLNFSQQYVKNTCYIYILSSEDSRVLPWLHLLHKRMKKQILKIIPEAALKCIITSTFKVA